jgi:hypothetical protein
MAILAAWISWQTHSMSIAGTKYLAPTAESFGLVHKSEPIAIGFVKPIADAQGKQ